MNAACPSTAAPPAVLATEAPVERVVVNVIEERKFFRYQPCARLYHLYH